MVHERFDDGQTHAQTHGQTTLVVKSLSQLKTRNIYINKHLNQQVMQVHAHCLIKLLVNFVCLFQTKWLKAINSFGSILGLRANH